MQYKEVKLPIYPSANDPWVTRKDNDFYYCFSKNNRISVRHIHDLTDMSNDSDDFVWKPDENAFYSRELWAPELHYLQGHWYIYVAADDGRNENHRMLVLKGKSQDPTQPFELVGKIYSADNHWAIDGTVLEYKDELFFIWSGWEGDVDGKQNLYIAHMSDPTHIDSDRVLLSSPELEWECRAMPINEGPVCITEGDMVYLVYSASGSWTDDYCLGMLELEGTNPLDKQCWKKRKLPVFQQSFGCYGPGHCSFVKAIDQQIWMIYHANSEPNKGWDGRNLRIQTVQVVNQSDCVLGTPLPAGAIVEVPVSDSIMLKNLKT